MGGVRSWLIAGCCDHDPRFSWAGKLQHLPVLPLHRVLGQGGGEEGEGVVAHDLVLGEGGGGEDGQDQDQGHQSHPWHLCLSLLCLSLAGFHWSRYHVRISNATSNGSSTCLSLKGPPFHNHKKRSKSVGRNSFERVCFNFIPDLQAMTRILYPSWILKNTLTISNAYKI